MYYEEQVINGVLCHRSSRKGKWIQFTLEELTTKILDLRGDTQELLQEINDLKGQAFERDILS